MAKRLTKDEKSFIENELSAMGKGEEDGTVTSDN